MVENGKMLYLYLFIFRTKTITPPIKNKRITPMMVKNFPLSSPVAGRLA